jgi:hypothetical protein
MLPLNHFWCQAWCYELVAVSMPELVQEPVTVSVRELQQAAKEEPRMVVQDLVQGMICLKRIYNF